MSGDTTYILLGMNETLPECGNDCIYREELDTGKTFCFPTSYSDLENQCDYRNIRPLLLIGFSSWSEWTDCRADCSKDMVGTSTRERSCEEDILDELSCTGPTKQVRNCEVECEHEHELEIRNNHCPLVENVKAKGYPCTYHFVNQKLSWDDAQKFCKARYNGKLWEPGTEPEYNAVINTAESKAGKPLGSCQWWLGLFNWNDGSPNSVAAYLSSTVTAPPTIGPQHNEPSPNDPRNGAISNFITVTDGNDSGEQNCVHTSYNWNNWRDHNCILMKNFICQSCPPPCFCSYNNVAYPCGSTIKRNPHCCSDLICNSNGIIVEKQLYDRNGKPDSGCCIWRGRMVRDGTEFGPWWARRVCCKGEILIKQRWWWPIFYYKFP